MPRRGQTGLLMLLLVWIAMHCISTSLAHAQQAPRRLPRSSAGEAVPIPVEWWREHVGAAMWEGERSIALDLNTLLVDTLLHSPRILGVGMETQVALAEVVVADAAFDPLALM